MPVAGDACARKTKIGENDPGLAAPAEVTNVTTVGQARNKKQEANMDALVLPPFNLTQRFTPIPKAQVYMCGQIAGKKQFVTNVTANMSKDFVTIMNQILAEAREGQFSTKQIRSGDEMYL